MFTFSFGSAFAATKTYSVEDYTNALETEMNAQLGYLESDFNQIINGLTYDSETGYDTAGFMKKSVSVRSGRCSG